MFVCQSGARERKKGRVFVSEWSTLFSVLCPVQWINKGTRVQCLYTCQSGAGERNKGRLCLSGALCQWTKKRTKVQFFCQSGAKRWWYI